MNHQVISDFQAKITDTNNWLKDELSKVRTGRAAPSFLDPVQVESYGSMMPLNQVASINIEDAKTIRIAPWDSSMVKPIENAVTRADLGVSCSSDDSGVRVHFPDLTTETREKIARNAKQKHEEARVALRGERDEVRGEINKLQKSGEMSEDLRDELLAKVDELTTKANKDFDEVYEAKYRELTTL